MRVALPALVVLVTSFNVPAAGQVWPGEGLADTEVRTLTSSAVSGYEYGIWVALPSGYSESSERYPVLYFLDASNQFGIVVQTYRLLRAFNEVPPLVIVGIAHTKDFLSDRGRDFMPTSLTQEQVREKYGNGMAGFLPKTGGASAFLRFVRDEAIPFVEREYRVDPSVRGLFGHSAGGLFAAYALFNEPTLFNRVLIASSAVWWDDYEVMEDEERYARDHDQLEARVLATVGSNEGDLIVGAWKALRDRLSSRGYRGMNFTALMFEGESHVSVPPVTYSKALRILFGPGGE